MKAKPLSHVRLLVISWTANYQAPLSMGFSRQKHWSRVPLPSPPSPNPGVTLQRTQARPWGGTAHPQLNRMFWLELKSQALRPRLCPPKSSFFLSEQRRGHGPCPPHFLLSLGGGLCPRQWGQGCGSHLGLMVCVLSHSVMSNSL